MNYDILDVTSLPVDVVIQMASSYPITGNDVHKAVRHEWSFGGSGNLFIVFSRLGGTVLPIGPVGCDPYGNWIVRQCRKLNIEHRGLCRIKGYQTQAAICLVDARKKHSFISTFPSAPLFLTAETKQMIQNCRAFYLSGFSLAKENPQEKNPLHDICVQLLKEFKNAGRCIYFDPGPRIAKIPPETMTEILNSSSVLCFNREEALVFTGRKTVEEAAEALSQSSFAMVVIKAGEKGCYVRTGETGKWYPGFPITVADTMGAGDSFLAALIYAHMHHWDMDSAFLLANAAGAVTSSKYGTGEHVAEKVEIEQLLKQNGYILTETGIIPG